jgi:hypothetical protein
MKFDWIDISIIASYIALSIFIGFWISKKAGKSLQNYFLGGNRLKWYYLGLSNGSGMFDVSGAAWTVTIFFVYGLKSVWIPWLWPVWNQIFVMIFMAIWLRRSNVMTGAEWITTRFGNDNGGKFSHINELDEFLSVNKQLADRYGIRSWSNSESFDRDMPIKFMPIKWEKLLMKLKAAERAGMEQTITFEFSHFMSPQSACLQAGHLYNRYREYLQNLK